MDVAAGPSHDSPAIHLQPQTPKVVGPLDKTTSVKVGEEYLLDGRVKSGILGCGWKASGVDVDVSLAVFSEKRNVVDVIWWDKKVSHYVSAVHLHDDRDGTLIENTDINEQISVKFEEVPPKVHYMLVVVTVYSKGKSLKDASDLVLKLSHGDKDLLRFEAGSYQSTACVMGMFARLGSWWMFKALGRAAVGRTVKEVINNLVIKEIIPEPTNAANEMSVYTWATEGHGLAASDHSITGRRTSDCFVEIKYKHRRVVSEVILKTLDPKWDMTGFDLGLSNEADHTLIVFNVWDHDTNSPDDFLGRSTWGVFYFVSGVGCALVAIGGVVQKGVGTHSMKLELGPSLDPDLVPEKGVVISGSIDVKFEVAKPKEISSKVP